MGTKKKKKKSSSDSSAFSMEAIEDGVREAIRDANMLPDEQRKAALRELRLRWHPDKNKMLKDFATEVSKIINDELAAAEEKEQFQAAESALAALCALTGGEETREREEYNAATEEFLAMADSAHHVEGYDSSNPGYGGGWFTGQVSQPCEDDSSDEDQEAVDVALLGQVTAPCEDDSSEEEVDKKGSSKDPEQVAAPLPQLSKPCEDDSSEEESESDESSESSDEAVQEDDADNKSILDAENDGDKDAENDGDKDAETLEEDTLLEKTPEQVLVEFQLAEKEQKMREKNDHDTRKQALRDRLVKRKKKAEVSAVSEAAHA